MVAGGSRSTGLFVSAYTDCELYWRMAAVSETRSAVQSVAMSACLFSPGSLASTGFPHFPARALKRSEPLISLLLLILETVRHPMLLYVPLDDPPASDLTIVEDMTSTPTQTKRLTVVSTSFDPRDPRTHSQLVRVAIPPFASGSWHLEYEPPSSSIGRFQPARVNLRWSGCTDSTLRRARLAVTVGDESHASTGVLQVDGPGNGGWSLAVGRPNRECTVVLEIEPDDVAANAAALLPIERCLALVDGPGAIDLCLTFAGDSRKLWASSQMLARVSPWFATYITTSGYFESSISHAATPAERADWDDSDCSDDEEDEDENGGIGSQCNQLHHGAAAALLDTPPPSPPTKLRDLPSWCRVVPIQGTSYRTYRAFLAWVLTGCEIEFAPLTSSFRFSPFDPRKAASSSATSAVPSRCASPAPGRKTTGGGRGTAASSTTTITNGIGPSTASARKRRAAALAPFSRLYPSRPKPVSPKSLYRLAHFLDIPALQAICLAALKDKLSPEICAYELFDDPMAEVYDEVVRAELDYAVANWPRVKSSRAMKDVQERMLEEGATMYELRALFRLSGVD